MISSTTETGTTRDGVEQLRRRWVPTAPRAAMLLVHGIGEHSGRYEHVGAAFADTGIDVLAFDQRGFGRTAGRRGHVHSFDEFLADIEDLLGDRRSLDVPVILMGHSLGGLISTKYLVGDRLLPDLAVLSAPALAADIPRWQRFAAPLLGAIAPNISIPADFDGSVLSRDEAVQVAYETDPLRVPSSTARLGRESLHAMKEVNMTLDRLTVPTYVLHGSDDTLVPPSASEPLAVLPNVTRRVWDGLRHECLNEPERDEVIAEIVAWIDGRLATP
ncbi:lysophospholipase [Ilumatobacter sp.]|uniref:alpha/beta hydrolase n=1 Tax=Ilumatobacter sp. TaxID=1967498 RepID=UPI003C5B530E